jgi:hypothetical protein
MSNSAVHCFQDITLSFHNNMFTVQPSRSRRSSKAKATFTPDEPRHVVIHDYHDHSMDTPHDIIDQSHEETSVDDHKKRSGPRGGVNVPFPTKLHVMLSKVEAEGLTDIVSWYVIHRTRDIFACKILTYLILVSMNCIPGNRMGDVLLFTNLGSSSIRSCPNTSVSRN